MPASVANPNGGELGPTEAWCALFLGQGIFIVVNHILTNPQFEIQSVAMVPSEWNSNKNIIFIFIEFYLTFTVKYFKCFRCSLIDSSLKPYIVGISYHFYFKDRKVKHSDKLRALAKLCSSYMGGL